MELSGHGVMASVRRFGAPRQSTVGGHLRKEHLYKEQNRNKIGGGGGPQEFQGRMDPVFAAHLDLGVEAHHIGGDLPVGATGRSGSKSVAHVKNIGFGDDRPLRLGQGLGLQIGQAGKDDHHGPGQHSWQGQKPGMQGRSMHRGQGLSHVLIGQNSLHDQHIHQIHAAPETLAPLEGHHSQHQDAAQHIDKWVATPSKGGPVGNSNNPLLGDDHLRTLLGDVNSELMMRVQRASAALDKLWDLLDIDKDGMVNYYDTKNIFAKWSSALSFEADKYINDEEKSSESKITYKRFIDIFLPIALTVSPDLIFAHLSNRFTAATQKRNPNLIPDDQKRAPSGRKSMTGHGLAEMMGVTNQPQGNQASRVGQSMAILQKQKSMQGQQNPEFSVDGHKRASMERNKGQASSIDKINAMKRGSVARAAMDPRRQTMGTGVNHSNKTDLSGPSTEPGPGIRAQSVFSVKSAARSQSVAIPQKSTLRGSLT